MPTIKFIPMTKEIGVRVPHPKPARDYIPERYKRMPLFVGGEKKYKDGLLTNKTVKLCMPFSDTFQTGYIQETWTDIYVSTRNEELEWHYSCEPEIMAMRSNHPDSVMEIPGGFINQEFTWKMPWSPKLPKGYSALITHPLNRNDLPFETATGIVDTDGFGMYPFPNNLPFFIYNDFEGVIPAGTPMFQIIPIKRESWNTEVFPYDEEEVTKQKHAVARKFYGGYRDNFWHKKEYK